MHGPGDLASITHPTTTPPPFKNLTRFTQWYNSSAFNNHVHAIVHVSMLKSMLDVEDSFWQNGILVTLFTNMPLLCATDKQ